MAIQFNLKSYIWKDLFFTGDIHPFTTSHLTCKDHAATTMFRIIFSRFQQIAQSFLFLYLFFFFKLHDYIKGILGNSSYSVNEANLGYFLLLCYTWYQQLPIVGVTLCRMSESTPQSHPLQNKVEWGYSQLIKAIWADYVSVVKSALFINHKIFVSGVLLSSDPKVSKMIGL